MTRPPPHERPSAGQLAAASQQANGVDPWACRNCGCKMWRVKDSRLVGDERKRERICLNCGEPLPTVEVPVPPGCKLKIVPEDEVA